MYTVLIQTRNRPDRLKRLLTYLADNKETSKIIVADGSDPEALSINQQTLSELKIRTLQHLIPVTQEQSQIFARIRTALSHVDTPLIAMIADDDFVFSDALREGRWFLAANPDFLSVTGKGVRVRPERFLFFTEPSNHKANGCEFEEGKRLSAQALPILSEATAPSEPSECALDDPAPG